MNNLVFLVLFAILFISNEGTLILRESDGVCYGQTDIFLDCSNDVIAISTVYAAVKSSEFACPSYVNSSVEYNSTCCVRSEGDCFFKSWINEAMKGSCNGRHDCPFGTANDAIVGKCNTEFIATLTYTNYIFVEYYCINSDLINTVCLTTERRTTGRIAYVQSLDFPSRFHTQSSECICLIEVNGTNASMKVFTIQRQLFSSSSLDSCTGAISLQDANKTVITAWDCNSPTGDIQTTELIGEHTVYFVVKQNVSGNFWIGFEATQNDSFVTITCPAAFPSSTISTSTITLTTALTSESTLQGINSTTTSTDASAISTNILTDNEQSTSSTTTELTMQSTTEPTTSAPDSTTTSTNRASTNMTSTPNIMTTPTPSSPSFPTTTASTTLTTMTNISTTMTHTNQPEQSTSTVNTSTSSSETRTMVSFSTSTTATDQSTSLESSTKSTTPETIVETNLQEMAALVQDPTTAALGLEQIKPSDGNIPDTTITLVSMMAVPVVVMLVLIINIIYLVASKKGAALASQSLAQGVAIAKPFPPFTHGQRGHHATPKQVNELSDHKHVKEYKLVKKVKFYEPLPDYDTTDTTDVIEPPPDYIDNQVNIIQEPLPDYPVFYSEVPVEPFPDYQLEFPHFYLEPRPDY